MVPKSLSGGPEKQRQRSIVLRKGDVGLPFKLSIDIDLREVGTAHRGDVVPGAGADQGRRMNLGKLAAGRTHFEPKDVGTSHPGLAQIKTFEIAIPRVLL